MPQRSEVAPRRPAHQSRTGRVAPWARPPTRQLDLPTATRPARPAPIPVFVDESGRRRRVGRVVGGCLGTLVLGYVAVAALTFAGAPLVGRIAPPGLGQLSRPAGDQGVGVGPGAQESPLPPAITGADDPATTPGNASPTDGADDPAEQPAPSTSTTTTPSTTTTAPPGQGSTTSVPAPNSTVPTHPTGGPPTEPPGKP
jgi:hypothetical protein